MYLLGFYTILGIVVTLIVATKPRLFWPALIFVTVGTAGLMAGRNTFVDEYLVGCVLCGGFSSILIGAVVLEIKKEHVYEHFHRVIFFLLIIYMIFQSVRGVVVLESLSKIRWVVYYSMLGIIAFVISHKGFPVPEPKKIAIIICRSTLVYLILYLAHGFFTEYIRGLDRFTVQTVEWSSTAYALFPLVIAIPAAIFLIQDKLHKYRRIGKIVLVTAILTSVYYLSRISWLAIFGFLFISILKSNVRKTVSFFVLLLLVFSLCFGLGIKRATFKERAQDFLDEFSRTGSSLYAWEESSQSEIERILHFKVGFVSVAENWQSFLFGYGFRKHGFIISPHLKKLYEDHGLPQLAARVKDDVSTEGFTALLVDTGWVGIALLVINFMSVAYQIYIQKKNSNRNLLLLSVCFTFIWLPTINMVDIMLFYLLIMPSGLLIQLSRYKPVEVKLGKG